MSGERSAGGRRSLSGKLAGYAPPRRARGARRKRRQGRGANSGGAPRCPRRCGEAFLAEHMQDVQLPLDWLVLVPDVITCSSPTVPCSLEARSRTVLHNVIDRLTDPAAARRRTSNTSEQTRKGGPIHHAHRLACLTRQSLSVYHLARHATSVVLQQLRRRSYAHDKGCQIDVRESGKAALGSGSLYCHPLIALALVLAPPPPPPPPPPLPTAGPGVYSTSVTAMRGQRMTHHSALPQHRAPYLLLYLCVTPRMVAPHRPPVRWRSE